MAKSRKKLKREIKNREDFKKFAITVGIITLMLLIVLYLMFSNI